MSIVSGAKKTYFKLSPEWTLKQIDRSLVISGGADARFEIELEQAEPSFFSTLESNKRFARADLSTHDQRVLEELLTAEIIVPEFQVTKKLRMAVIGDNHLLDIQSDDLIVSDQSDADLLLLVRTDSTYAKLLENIEYQNIIKPHLFIDMAFHHTASIGPLVFPGETACVACLQGRISTRWGDETPPNTPRSSKMYAAVVSKLLVTELNRIAAGDTSLTNKTFSWNFQERVIKKDQLLKVPICPICSKNTIDHSGALALPW